MAAKTTDQDLRQKIADQVTPGKAKRLGRSIELRDGWDNLKLHYMRVILEIKFSDPELMKMLQNTSGAHLIEGNTWGDKFWGESPIGTGSNNLGKILMSIRDDITRSF